MKKTSKIAPWIWRGAALLLAIYFLVAVVAGIPFFNTNVSPIFEDDGYYPATDEGVPNGAVITFCQNIEHHQFFTSLAFDLQISKIPNYLWAAAPSIHIANALGGKAVELHADNLVFEKISDQNRLHILSNTQIIGLRNPREITDDGETKIIPPEELPRFIRSYSSPMLPVIDTGSAVWGMLLLTAIPILLSFVYSRFCEKILSGEPKAVLYRGAKVKLIVAVCLMTVFSAAALFYLPGGKMIWENPWLNFRIDWLFPLLRWLTPIISIPALAVWVASFKNKKFAPAFAAAIMVLCLYQPLANLICLFATVIAWGYFAHGVCNLFGRFRKAKADAV